jgi:hypothetical protein
MPKLSSQSATCCVAELRWAAALGALRPFGFNALRGRALAGLPLALESFFIASTRGWERGIVSSPESTDHGGSSASVWVLLTATDLLFVHFVTGRANLPVRAKHTEDARQRGSGAEGGPMIKSLLALRRRKLVPRKRSKR